MMLKRSNPEAFRRVLEAAMASYQEALVQCKQDDLGKLQTCSMITRCLLELDRFPEAETMIQSTGDMIDKKFGQQPLSGDRLAIDLIRAQYLVIVGRRALHGIQDASTDSYAEMKLHLARPYYEEALKLYRIYQSSDDPEIAKFAVLCDVRAALELARGYIMPKTPAAKNNYQTARDMLAAANEKIKRNAGAPLAAEFEVVRPQIVRDLDWLDSQIKK